MSKSLLAIDLETSSEADIRAVGSIAYAMHPTTKIQLFSYKLDVDDVVTIDMAAGETLPDKIRDALVDPDVVKTAFNAQFEIEIINRTLGIKTVSSQWRCSQALALYAGLPGKLEHVSTALGLQEQKKEDGKSLIERYSTTSNPNTDTPLS